MRLWYLSHMRAGKAQTSLRIRGKRPRLNCPYTMEVHAVAVTSRNSLYLPHVCSSMYPNFVTCEDQLAHSKVLSAPLFLEQNIKHFVGQVLGPNCLLKLVCHSLFGGGGVPPRSHPGSGTANIISSRQRDRACLRSKKPTIRPRVVVVLRLGYHTMALTHESGLSTQNIIA